MVIRVSIDCRTFRTPTNLQDCTVVKIKHYNATVLDTRLWCGFIMNEKLIQSKIEELRVVLMEELPNTAVRFEITFTGTGTHQRIEHKQPEQLKRELISMRNVNGDIIR